MIYVLLNEIVLDQLHGKRALANCATTYNDQPILCHRGTCVSCLFSRLTKYFFDFRRILINLSYFCYLFLSVFVYLFLDLHSSHDLGDG